MYVNFIFFISSSGSALVHDDFGDHAAIELGQVAHLVQLGGVQEVGSRRHARGVDEDVVDLATTDVHGGHLAVDVLAVDAPHVLRAGTDDLHGQPLGGHGVELVDAEVAEPQQQLLACVDLDDRVQVLGGRAVVQNLARGAGDLAGIVSGNRVDVVGRRRQCHQRSGYPGSRDR